MVVPLALAALLALSACGGAPTAPPAAAPATTRDTCGARPVPLSLGDIPSTNYADVTLDLYCHTDTVQRRFVDAVYDEPYQGTVLGLYTPLRITDLNLLVYAMESCTGQPALPAEWAPAPGDTHSDVRAFAREVRRIAQRHLCPHL